MTANDQLVSMNIEYQHEVERYKNEEIVVVLAHLKILEKDFRAAMSKYIGKTMSKGDWTVLYKSLEKIRKNRSAKLKTELMKDLKKFSSSQEKVQKNFIKSILKKEGINETVSSVEDLWDKIERKTINFVDGNSYTLDQLYKTFDSKSKTLLKSVSNQAKIYLWSLDEYSDKMFGNISYSSKNKNNIKSVTATAIAGVMGITDNLLYSVNDHIFKGYQWISVLDDKTSDICLNLSDKYWVYDAPGASTLPYEITPPAHIRCRSATSPIFRTGEELGITDFNNAISTDNTYANWFSKQPASTKLAILGTVRYNMYKNGDTDISSYYQNDGRKLTLQELEAKGLSIPKEFERYIK